MGKAIVRLTGWILLLIGLLLCATISWAALGFLLMGIGLIALQVAERRPHRADTALATTSGFTPPLVGAGLQPPVLDPVAPQDPAPPRPARRMAAPDKANGAPYDREAWRRLVESDPDLAQLAKVLADYGPQYVDELATSYLAAPDKNRLGAIVDGIIARARSNQPVAPPARREEMRSRPLPRTEPLVKPPTERPDAVTASSPAPAHSADALEASLIAAVTEATAKRIDPAKPAAPPPVDGAPAADLDESLLAALAEISGENLAKTEDPTKDLPPDPPGPPADEGLTEMLKKFVPDSNLQRKQ